MNLVRALKKNRSNKFTQGIVITNNTNDKRFLFFELDKGYTQEEKQEVLDVYRFHGLDVLIHRTSSGIHFISPTLIELQTWKEAMNKLKEINKKCPMTTLRWLPNKYPNEAEIWYTSEYRSDPNNLRNNSNQLCTLLNHSFRSNFVGTIDTDLKFVRYPLP